MDKRFPFELRQQDAIRIIAVACSEWKIELERRWGHQLLYTKTIWVTETFYKEMRAACTTDQHKLLDEIFGKDKPKSRALQEIVDDFGGRIFHSYLEVFATGIVRSNTISIYLPYSNPKWFFCAMKYCEALFHYLEEQPEVGFKTYPTIKDNELIILVEMKE